MDIISFKLSQDQSALILEINDAALADTLYLWTEKTYKVDEFKIDLSNKLTGQYSQTIIITPEDLAIPEFDGVYFVDISAVNTNACAIVGALTRYEECILNETLDTQDCEDCIEELYAKALNLQTLLKGLELSIKHNLAQEALTIIYALDKYCTEACESCNKFKKV